MFRVHMTAFFTATPRPHAMALSGQLCAFAVPKMAFLVRGKVTPHFVVPVLFARQSTPFCNAETNNNVLPHPTPHTHTPDTTTAQKV